MSSPFHPLPFDRRTLIGFNVILAVIYIAFFFLLQIMVSDAVMFSTRDATTYLATSSEFYHLDLKGFSIIRPFLYPLLILIFHGIAGAWGLWFAQFLFWMLSINLVVLAIKYATGNTYLAFGAGIFMSLNLSAIALTAHALTEITTIFLLAALMFAISLWNERTLWPDRLLLCLAFFAVLASIKPLFFPLAIGTAIVIIAGFGKTLLQKPKKFAVFLLFLLPVVFQIFIMFVKYDSLFFSKIGSSTFINYLLTQGIATVEKTDIISANVTAQGMSVPDALHYVLDHHTVYAQWFFANLVMNVAGNAAYVIPPWSDYMNAVNILSAAMHLFFIALLIFVLFGAYKRFFIIPAFLTYYIFVTSAISAEQGDRLTLPALPVWVFCMRW